MMHIYSSADAHQIPLLIEADGARRLPLKAPDDHEPSIPGFVDCVVVVAGFSGLGKPLTPEWVHRPKIFSALSGLQPGEIVTPEALVQVITHADGGLKNIPPQACRIALLNQADTPELQAQAAALKSGLLTSFDAVVVSSLAPRASLSHLQSQIFAVCEPIAAVILAAGQARRFGSPKQLLDWHGKPLLWHVAQKALQVGLNPVVVVCGREMAAIQNALAGLPVKILHNPDWQQGQGTSVRAGAEAVRSRSGGILFLLADQPQIPVPLIRSLLEAHSRSLPPIIGPLIDGQRANPVLFDRVTFDDLRSLTGEIGGRKLFGKYPVHWIPWHDPVALLDVDTPEDYERLQGMDL
jgi:molybdenum cofactor cytidylyltransferase